MSGENMSVLDLDKSSIAELASLAISSPPPLVEKRHEKLYSCLAT